MSYFNRFDNVFMDGSAVVQQRVQHEDTYLDGTISPEYYGTWRSHYLE